MKRYFLYLSMLLLVSVFTGCSDDFDTPPMIVPEASVKPNMTIAEFKAKYWQDPVNYIDTVKEDVVIHGRVVSSDETGNIYKSLYIQDETGGLSISINGTSLYNKYRYGQDIVIPMKDLYVGKYNGQQQLGYPQYYEKGDVWEATFLPLALWQSTAQINGLPNLSEIDTMTIKISDLTARRESLLKYQGRLVKIENVKFEAADGTATYSEAKATTNRNIVDADGNKLVMRNSNYASFRNEILPQGSGDVVGLLSYYSTRSGSGTWQLYIRNTNDVMNFTTNTKGLMKDPYTVAEAIAAQNQGKTGWATGFIVGAVAAGKATVGSSSDVDWKAPASADNSLVIADDPNCTDISKCVIVPLPAGSPFQKKANLKDNAALYKTQLWVKGTLATAMGQAGVTVSQGSLEEFRLSIVTGGVTTLDEGFEGGKQLPEGWSSVTVSGDKNWYWTTFDNNTYAAVTGFKGTKPPFDAWLITPALDIKNAKSKILNFDTQVNGYGSSTSKFEVYVLNSADPATATVKKQLNPVLAKAPDNGYSGFANSGDIDLSAFADGSYYIGFRYYATPDSYYATWCLDNVKFNAGGGSSVQAITRGDFETFNNGNYTSTFGTYKSKDGWVATNCNILAGGEANSNPQYTFIGYKTGSDSQYAFAANLNGSTSTPGTLVSPVLKGGIAKLNLNYGYALTEANGVSFRIDIKQNGQVVKSFTVTKADAVKQTAYAAAFDVNVTGDFTIEFTNLSPSNKSATKDRVAIWNVTWTQPQ